VQGAKRSQLKTPEEDILQTTFHFKIDYIATDFTPRQRKLTIKENLMKQRLPTYLYQYKLSDKQRDLNDTVHYVFWLFTLIASYTSDKSIVYLSFHRAASITQQEGIHITTARFYQAIDELIDTNVIVATEFFSFIQ